MRMTKVGVVGGTGQLGGALAARWARAGLEVFIGSRDADRGKAAGEAIGANGGSNLDAARYGEIVVVTVPFSSQADTFQEIAEVCDQKIVVDTTVPLVPPKVMRAQLPEEGSAAKKADALLPEGATLVSAFHNVAAHKLADLSWEGNCDILVFGEKKTARAEVVKLAEEAGLRGIHAGSLDNSCAAEAMTSLLIFINKFYSVDGAGIMITGDLKVPE